MSCCRKTQETDAEEEKSQSETGKNKKRQPVIHADAAGRNLSPVFISVVFSGSCSCLGNTPRLYLDFAKSKTCVYSAEKDGVETLEECQHHTANFITEICPSVYLSTCLPVYLPLGRSDL